MSSDTHSARCGRPRLHAGNGLFQVQVYNKQTGLTQTTDIRVDLNGLDADTTLQSLAAQLDAIDGISASVTHRPANCRSRATRRKSRSPLPTTPAARWRPWASTRSSRAAAPENIGVNQVVKTDPSEAGDFQRRRRGRHEQWPAAGESARHARSARSGAFARRHVRAIDRQRRPGSQSASAAADGFRNFQQALEGQHLAISGVNIDEEAVRMIEYQRVYQASAKVISTVNELLANAAQPVSG